MRLTRRILEAIADMSDRVEADLVENIYGRDTPENQRLYEAALDAGIWARAEIRRREQRRAKAKPKETTP